MLVNRDIAILSKFSDTLIKGKSVPNGTITEHPDGSRSKKVDGKWISLPNLHKPISKREELDNTKFVEKIQKEIDEIDLKLVSIYEQAKKEKERYEGLQQVVRELKIRGELNTSFKSKEEREASIAYKELEITVSRIHHWEKKKRNLELKLQDESQ